MPDGIMRTNDLIMQTHLVTHDLQQHTHDSLISAFIVDFPTIYTHVYIHRSQKLIKLFYT